MTEPRCYTIAEICARTKIPRRSFNRLRAAGKLPYLEELLPRSGRKPRYRADLVDRYLAGQFYSRRHSA